MLVRPPDNGKSIRCTPDHLFMLRNGAYQRADELSPGQSLMPLYVTADKDRYVVVRNNSTHKLMRCTTWYTARTLHQT